MRKLVSIAVLVTALVAAACGSDSGDTAQTSAATTAADDHSSGGHDESLFTFGEPASASDATRTIPITIQGSELKFNPDTVTVQAGETVAFEVTNDSQLEHDFTLGDEQTQIDHAEQMASMADHSGMADEANAVLLPPGVTKTVAWRFTEPGTVLYGCHITGHYGAGMKGTVEVTP